MAFISARQFGSGPPRRVPKDVANLRATLTNLNFARTVVQWAKWTDAGLAHYGVGTLSDGKLKGSPLVVVTVRLYCEKTPKILSAADWKAPFAVNWTMISVLEWQYQAPGVEKIRVVVEPDDRLKLDALIGSCVQRRAFFKPVNGFVEKEQNGLLTLGLIIRHFTKKPDDSGKPSQPQSTKWAVLVAHSFNFRVGSSSHPKNELLACPKNETECKICVSASCVGCGSIPNKVSLALGNDQIFRTRDGLYDHLKTLDVSVAALPDESAINFKPLDVRDFKKALEQEKPEKYEPGTWVAAKTAFDELEKAADLADENTLVTAHAEKKTVYLFKKGAMTGWTWGLLQHADEFTFTVLSTAIDPKTNPISLGGDCGAIWFVLEEGEKQARAVGCHYARTSNDPNANHDECKMAKGFHYGAAFTNAAAQGIMQITSWSKDDFGFNFAESYGPKG